MHDVAAWQLGRQLPALLLFGLHVLGRRHLGVRRIGLGLLRLRGNRLGLRRLGFLQRQLELFDRALDLLRTRTELFAAKLGDLGFQLLDRQLRDDEAVLGCRQLGFVTSRPTAPPSRSAALQRGNIVGKLIGRERHARLDICFAPIPRASAPKFVADFAIRDLRATSTSAPGSTSPRPSASMAT